MVLTTASGLPKCPSLRLPEGHLLGGGQGEASRQTEVEGPVDRKPRRSGRTWPGEIGWEMDFLATKDEPMIGFNDFLVNENDENEW